MDPENEDVISVDKENAKDIVSKTQKKIEKELHLVQSQIEKLKEVRQ